MLMADSIKKGDFVEVDYTGRLTTGEVFDTTEEKVARANGLYNDRTKFSPTTVCIGEGQILPGLELEMENKEIGKEYHIKIQPEHGFGKRDVKKIKIVPASTFKEHNVHPQKGLQVEVDGEMGLITGMSGGRVIVNFNHPLAGKEVEYTFTIRKKITDHKEQLLSFLQTTMHLPKEKIKVEVQGEKAEVELPFQLPPQFTEMMSKKLGELTKLKEITIKAGSRVEGKSEHKTNHIHGPHCQH